LGPKIPKNVSKTRKVYECWIGSATAPGDDGTGVKKKAMHGNEKDSNK